MKTPDQKVQLTDLLPNLIASEFDQREPARRSEIHIATIRIACLPTIDPLLSMRGALAIACEFLGFPVGATSVIEGDTGRIVAQVSPNSEIQDGQTFDMAGTFCRLALANRDLMAISDVAASTSRVDPRGKQMSIEAYVGVPIFIEGNRLGVLEFFSPEPRSQPFREAEAEFVQFLGVWMGDRLHRAKIDENLLRQGQLNQLVTKAQAHFIREGSAHKAFNELLEDLLALTSSEYGFIGEVCEAPDDSRFLRAWTIRRDESDGEFRFETRDRMVFPGDDTIVGRALATGEAVIENAPDMDPRRVGLAPEDPKLNTCLIVPVPTVEGLAGVVVIANRRWGYDSAAAECLDPMLSFIGQLIVASQTREKIGESKRVQRAPQQEIEKAEHASRAKSDFISAMSHELRMPLNSIIGFAELLELDTQLSYDSRRNVEEVLIAGRMLVELTNDVLDLARLEAGRLPLEMKVVSLEQTANECISLINATARARSIRIETHIPAGAAVRADRLRLKQVLLNLVSNAVKYNCEGGNVDIRASRKGGNWILSVIDTGEGIPADQFEALFEPFNRLKADHTSVEGSGIGLSLARELAEVMGGSLTVASEPGEGSTFSIRLAESAPVESREPSFNPVARQGPLPEQTVLCIEDNPVNLKLIARILGRRGGIRMLNAYNGESGLALARDERPALILLDIGLPGMNGYEVFRELRSAAETRDVPVVAVSANATPQDVKRGIEAGFLEYLTKPIDINHLNRVLDRVLKLAGDEVAACD